MASAAPPTLRPRSATELVDASFQLYRAHFTTFVMCAAVAYLPLVIMQLLYVGDSNALIAEGTPDAMMRMMGRNFVGYLAHAVVVSLMTGVLVVCASQAYLGERVDMGTAVRRVVPRAGRLVLSAMLLLAMYVGALFAFVFPIVYVFARYFAVTPAIVLEDVDLTGAFRHSSELSRGRKRHVLNTIGLASLIYWIVLISVAVVATLAAQSFVLRTVMAAMATVVVYPVVAVALTLVYYDTRIRNEGLDIELMTDALLPPPPAVPPSAPSSAPTIAS